MSEHGATDMYAVLYSATAPDEHQMRRLRDFVSEKHGSGTVLIWKQSNELHGGFRLVVGTETYDWSIAGRYKQLRDILRGVHGGEGDIVSLLKETIDNFEPQAVAHEIGTVLTVGDDIAAVSGLENATYGEIVVFASGAKGMILDLREDEVGCIVFDDDESIVAGSAVYRTGRTAGMPVGDDYLGRVINPLGVPLDGKGPVTCTDYRPIETPAPGIIDRQPVNTPLETGILAIDTMFPIGRGQRELIIGDRQTGKTAIALDTILNQKDKDVICIYVAIGQKASSVAKLTETLRKRGALEYTVVIAATASDPATIQYIAPYSGCSLGEFFANRGQDVLIVYDDLSKHAIAYRTLSLLLERSPGREAYPGDVFYLHSRLLERSAHLSDERGGGSMTALPIVETQAGDVSAYIPTNIISITDGQIFLENNLFFSGQRPAINVGLSVSRVGGAAQTKAMKAATSTLRLDLAQYREMEVFTQFSSDLDDATKNQLLYGRSLMYMLRQQQYHPLKQHEQVITLVAALNHTMQSIPPEKIADFRDGFLRYTEEKEGDICSVIDHTGVLTPETRRSIQEAAKKYLEIFNANQQGR